MPGTGSGNPAARAQLGSALGAGARADGGSRLAGCSELTTQEAGTEPRGLTVTAKVQHRTGPNLPSLGVGWSDAEFTLEECTVIKICSVSLPGLLPCPL